MPGNERRLTQSERILLHLCRFDHDPMQYLAPYGLCQDGIGEALDILKNNVSREISKLKEEGLVTEELGRVKGVDRRRNIYLITAKGKDVCRNISGEIGENRIRFKDGSNIRNINTKQAVKKLKTRFSHVDAFHVEEWMRYKDVLDLDEFVQYHSSKNNKETTYEMIAGAPLIEDFYGREGEIGSIMELLSKTDTPMIVITGIAGIGKSSLGAMILEKMRENKNIFWHNIHRWETRDELIKDLNSFAKMVSGHNLNEDGLYGTLREFIYRTDGPIIFLDNCDEATSEMKDVFEILLELKKSGYDLEAIFMSRDDMSFYDVRDVMAEYVVEFTLGPLDENIIKDVLGDKSQDIMEITKGHPLYTELYRKHGGGYSDISVNKFIIDEIYSKLPKKEKELIKRLAVMCGAVEKNVVREADDTDALINLKESHLVEETEDGRIGIHALLKDFIYNNLSPKEKRKLHASAGRKLTGNGNYTDLEILYHYEMGGLWLKAFELLKSQKDAVAGLHEEHRNELIDKFPDDLIPKENLADYDELIGDIYLQAKEWDKALNSFEKAKRMYTGDITSLTEKIGEAQRNLHRWDDAIKSHMKALKNYRGAGDREGESRELLALGTVYRKRGDLHKAKEFYRKAEEIIESEKLEKARCVLYNNLGILYKHEKDFGTAQRYLKKALDTGGERGIIYENLADIYHEIGNHEKEMEILRAALEYYMEMGRWRDASNVFLSRGKIFAVCGMIEKAEKYFRKGIAIEEEHRKVFRIFMTKNMSSVELDMHDELANILKGRDWEECFKHRKLVIEDLEKKGDIRKSLLARLRYAFDLRDSGNLHDALEELKLLEKALKKMNEYSGLIACGLETSRIYITLGKYKDASGVLNAVIDVAKKSDDTEGKVQAEKLLDRI